MNTIYIPWFFVILLYLCFVLYHKYKFENKLLEKTIKHYQTNDTPIKYSSEEILYKVFYNIAPPFFIAWLLILFNVIIERV